MRLRVDPPSFFTPRATPKRNKHPPTETLLEEDAVLNAMVVPHTFGRGVGGGGQGKGEGS